MRFDDNFIEELRLRNDIESVVSSYVQLKRGGRTLLGICPFHNESTPSFHIYPDNQSFYCFGCGAGGNVITFIRKIENLDYTDAVRFLCDRAGMQMPSSIVDDGASLIRRRTLEANREAAKYFHGMLMSSQGSTALKYFVDRGVSRELIKHFGLGFAPDSGFGLLNYMKSKGFNEAELAAMDLCRQSSRTGRYYDTFRNRVIIPIIDVGGNVIAFGGRVLDDSKPKYLNTSDTKVYHKGKELFAMNFAKNGNSRKLILCEGYMDVIAFHQYGFTNAVAGLGTALTKDQAKFISRYADEVCICYDSDEAGIKATNKALDIFADTGLKIKVIKLTGGKDPDEILRKKGAGYMTALIEGSRNDTEFKLDIARTKFDTNTDDGKNAFLNDAVSTLAGLSNEIERDIYVRRLAEETGVSREAIETQIKKTRQKFAKRENAELFNGARKSLMPGNTIINGVKEQSGRAASKAQRIIISALIKNPDYLVNVAPRLKATDFPDELYGRFYTLISNAINEKRTPSVDSFEQDLQPDEMSVLCSIVTEYASFSNTLREIYDCIEALRKEKSSQNKIQPSHLSDEDFMKLFK